MIAYLDKLIIGIKSGQYWYIVLAVVIYCFSNFGYYIFKVYPFEDDDLQISLVLLCARLQVAAIGLFVIGICKTLISDFIFYIICLFVTIVSLTIMMLMIAKKE